MEKVDIVDAMLLTQRPPKKSKKTEEPTAPAPAPPPAPTPPPAEPPKEPTPPVEPEKPKRPRTHRPPPAPALTAEDAARIAAETVKAVLPAQPAAIDDDLPDDLRKQEAVYAELERQNPDRYKGVLRKLANFRKAEVSRADAWEAAHPGQAYNADDAEHTDWYAKNQPRIDPDDLDEARFEVRLKKRLERDVDPKLKEAEKTIARLRAEPEAESAAAQYGRAVFEALDPKTVESKESYDAWASSNPVVVEVAQELVRPAGDVVKAASMLWDGVVTLDVNDKVHKDARSYFMSFEKELAASEQPVVDKHGRRWVPLVEFGALSEDERQDVFTTTKAALVRYIGLSVADRIKAVAKERLDFVEKYAQKMGFTRASATPAAPQTPSLAQPTPPPTPSKPAPLPASPSVGAGEGTGPSVGTTPNTPATSKDLMTKLLGL